MVKIMLLAAVSFAATNIDDMLLNMVFFAACSSKSERYSVVTGKFLATALMVATATLGGMGMQTFADRYVWLLGFVPLILGTKELISLLKKEDDGDNISFSAKNTVFSTLRITLASGADNIGVYVPLFASVEIVQMAVCAVVFFALTGLWCFIAYRLTEFPAVQKTIGEYRKIIVPVVYIALGLYISLKR